VKRLLFVCPLLDVGGAERHWANLLPMLSDRGASVRLVAVKAGGRAFESLRAAGVSTVVLGGRGGIASTVKIFDLRRELDAGLDCVVTWGFDAHALVGLLARGYRVPHVVQWQAGPGLHVTAFQRIGLALAIRNGAGALAVSTSQLPDLRRLGFRDDRIAVEPQCVPQPSIDFAGAGEARAALGLPADAFIPALVGRLAPEKRIDRFIDAVGALQRRGRRVVGLVVGDGPEGGKLRERAAAAGVAIEFAGYQTSPGNYMCAADVVCLTSDREALPLTLLEAAACGRPCVAMGVGGVADVVVSGRTGVVTPAGDVHAFVDALDAFATAPATALEYGHRARERWEATYAVDAIADAYYELLVTVSGPPVVWGS